MSDNILDADDLFEQADDLFEQADEVLAPADDVVQDTTDQVAMTAQEAVDAPVEEAQPKKKSFLKSFSVFDGLLLISLICVGLATLILFLELNKFGSLTGGFPWRTTEFLNQ